MKKQLILLITIMILGFGLNGCTASKNPKTDNQIKNDALAIQPVKSSLILMKSCTIESTNLTSDAFTALVTVKMTTTDDTLQVLVTLNYKKYEKTWYVDTYDTLVQKVETSFYPSAPAVLDLLGSDQILSVAHDGMHLLQPIKAVLDPVDGSGKLTYAFSQDGGNASWVNRLEGSAEANYGLGKRWILSITTQSYTETMDWSGTYTIWPNRYDNEDYTRYDPFTLKITGTVGLTDDGKGHVETTSTLMGKFTIDGIPYEVAGLVKTDVTKMNTRTIVFPYGTKGDQLTLRLEFGAQNDNDYVNYSASYTGYNADVTID